MFKIGDYVVYGIDGVCRVGAVGPITMMNGETTEKPYYTLVPVYAEGSTVYSPVSNQKVVMRKILTREETNDLIKDIPGMKPLDVPDEKSREKVYKSAIQSCDCRELVRLIKTVYFRKEHRLSRGKKSTAVDEKYYHAAQDQLYGELAIPLQIDRSKVREYIAESVGDPVENPDEQ